MAEKKPLNRGAKILKDKLDKARIKNANSRARKNAKPGTGTISEKLKEASSRKPPKSNLPAIRKENLPAKSPGRNVVKFKAPGREVVPYKPPGREVVPYKGGAAGNAAKSFVGRRALAALGPAGMLASMTTSTGDGQEDKPRGPLMRGRAVARYEDQQVSRAGKGDLPKGKVNAPPKPKAKPAREASPEKKKLASEFRSKMQGQNKAQGQKKTFAKPKEKTYPFKGNWVGAAPTEMQKRGGQRRKQGNLMSFLKKMRDD